MSTIPEGTDAEAPATAPFFIVGSRRSGTTLLRMMLCSHSRLSIPPETWYLRPLLERFSIDRTLDAAEIESAVTIVTQQPRWPDQRLDAQEFRRRLSRVAMPHLRDVVEVVYRWHLEVEGKARWADKTPGYIDIVPQLARMFPASRFIHLVRDGRDVAKSLQAAVWGAYWLHDNTREWINAVECYGRWAGSELGERILQVRYEDLVLDSETALRRICQFIGEKFEPQMLSWEQKVDEQIPERHRHIHPKLKRRIGAEGVARWKREMTPRELFVAEAFMGPHLARAGYERRYPSPFWAPAFALTRLYCRTLEMQMSAARFLRRRVAPRLGWKWCETEQPSSPQARDGDMK
jgi:sulfotransferase family protein